MKNQSRIYKLLLGAALIAELVCFAPDVYSQNKKGNKMEEVKKITMKSPNGRIATIYFTGGSVGIMPENFQPKSKLIIKSGGFVGYPEKRISISISEYNKLANHLEWELTDTYIKNDCFTYQWINKESGEIIETLGLNPPGHKLDVRGAKSN